ncbi:MAG TPA: LuxR C-terminal-related transcriptional regulator [Polyangiaceae bacterium]|nr:LuxR C-terminal-related transcriptional regulator [Polyangiaceae bacterium]
MGRAVFWLAENARGAGAATEAALAEIGLPEAELLRPGCRVDWARFAAFLTELEASCGGPDGIAHALEHGYPKSAPEFLPVFGALVSPREVFRFTHRVLFPFCYRVVACSEHDVGEGRFRVEYRIMPPHVACPAFFHATAGAMRSTPCMFGQRSAKVRLEAGEREATFHIELPPSPTVLARAKRFVSQRWLRRTVEEVERDWTEMHQQMELLEREVEARGRAETALRAALDALSATAFVVGADAKVSALDVAGEAALANDDGSLERRLVEAPTERAQDGLRVLPLRDERGHVVLLHDGAQAFAGRLERVAAAWCLTPRQVEVVALVARGYANKEIAASLGCALHTIELHVTEILRRARLSSRAALVAEIWAQPLVG